MLHNANSSNLFSDALGALLVRAGGIVLTFGCTMLTAKLLGPAEYGAYSAAMSLALLLATLAPLGADRILVRNLSTTRSSEAAGAETALAHACTSVAVIVLMCLLLTVALICTRLLERPDWSRTALLASILFVPLTVIYLRQWVAIPLIGTRQAMMPEQTFLPAGFLLTLLAIFACGISLRAAGAALLYATLLTLIWAGSLRAKPLRAAYRSAWSTAGGLTSRQLRHRLQEGISFAAIAAGAILSQTCMPLVIAATCGFREAGCWALAMPFAALPAIPLGVFNLTMFPRCARHFQRGEFDEVNALVRQAAAAAFFLSLVIGLVVWIASPLLTRVLGPDFAMVRSVLPFLLLAAIIDSFTGPTIPVMQTMSMERCYSLTLLVFIPLQLLLIRVCGAVASVEGAAMACLLSRVIWNVVVVIEIRVIRGLVMLPDLSLTHLLTQQLFFVRHKSTTESGGAHLLLPSDSRPETRAA